MSHQETQQPGRFLLLHGIEHDQPPGHWLYWLASSLRGRGESVSYPQLPQADAPSLERWLESLEAELAVLDDGVGVVLCHSLSCLLWFHHCARATLQQRVERVLLVAPPSPNLPVPAIQAFAPPATLTPAAVAASARSGVRVLASDGDPYCPEGARALFAAPLRLEIDVIAGGGHLSEPDGYGPWPSMLAWCLDPAVRLRGNAD